MLTGHERDVVVVAESGKDRVSRLFAYHLEPDHERRHGRLVVELYSDLRRGPGRAPASGDRAATGGAANCYRREDKMEIPADSDLT